MSLFDDHVGVWCGTHIVMDGHGRETERFDGTVICQREGERWVQTSARARADGHIAETGFEGRLDGHARDLGTGDIVSVWRDPERPAVSYSALITLLSHDRRVRTIQKIEAGKHVSTTLIRESRVR
jgi:hypothetical protein